MGESLDNATIKGIRQKTIVKPGGAIELESTDLSAGTFVEVIVLVDESKPVDQGSQTSPDTLSQEEKWADFYSVLGAWKDNEDIDQVFAEIDRERHLDYGRHAPIFDD